MKLRSLFSVILIGLMSLGLSQAVSAQSKPAKPATMSISDSNKARFRMFWDEIINAKKVAMIDEFFDAAFVEHQVTPGYTPDAAGTKKFFTDMLTAFPDMKATIDIMTGDGDLVAALTTLTGTHKGEFMGAPATGKTVTFKVCDIVRIKDGKAVEHWGVSEDLAIMTQLGLVHMGH